MGDADRGQAVGADAVDRGPRAVPAGPRSSPAYSLSLPPSLARSLARSLPLYLPRSLLRSLRPSLAPSLAPPPLSLARSLPQTAGAAVWLGVISRNLFGIARLSLSLSLSPSLCHSERCPSLASSLLAPHESSLALRVYRFSRSLIPSLPSPASPEAQTLLSAQNFSLSVQCAGKGGGSEVEEPAGY